MNHELFHSTYFVLVSPAQNMCHLAKHDLLFTFHAKCHFLEKAFPIDSPGTLPFLAPTGLSPGIPTAQ